MNHRAMADRHIIFDDVRFSAIAMNDRAILHIHPRTDGDGRDISPHDGVEPEAGAVSNANFAHDRGITGDIMNARRHGRTVPMALAMANSRARLFATDGAPLLAHQALHN